MAKGSHLLGFVLLAVSLLGGATSAEAAFPGANGKIAYTNPTTSSDPNGFEIYKMSPDGSGQTALSNNPAYEIRPAWSADGTKIAFTRERLNGTDTTIVMNADGSGQMDVGFGFTYSLSPMWSPDGTKIVVMGSTEPPPAYPHIYTMNANGTGITQVTPTIEAADENPAWSPDGELIAFDSYRDLGSDAELWVVKPDGSQLTRLTNDSGPQYDPDWAPDSSRIAFQGPNTDIWTIKPDGTGMTDVSNSPTSSENYPAFSPDGKKIVFRHHETSSIAVMNADGSNAVDLWEVIGGWPDWQPAVPRAPAPYDAPASASPLRFSLVPELRQTISQSQCQARGGLPSMHGAPLSLSSCNPPGYVSGTAARMGSRGFGQARVEAVAGDTATPADDADLWMSLLLTDVRAMLGGGDYLPNPVGADVTLLARVRISDTDNGPSETDPATVADFELPAPGDCAATADPVLGATCSVNASVDAMTPGAIKEGTHMVVQTFRVRVRDSGANGTRGDADDRHIVSQGIYVP